VHMPFSTKSTSNLSFLTAICFSFII